MASAGITTLATADVDPTTQSNYLAVASQHVHFDWDVDFENEVLAGSSTHDVRVLQDGVGEVMCVLPLSHLSYWLKPWCSNPARWDGRLAAHTCLQVV